jgi:hypothetical protein
MVGMWMRKNAGKEMDSLWHESRPISYIVQIKATRGDVDRDHRVAFHPRKIVPRTAKERERNEKV